MQEVAQLLLDELSLRTALPTAQLQGLGARYKGMSGVAASTCPTSCAMLASMGWSLPQPLGLGLAQAQPLELGQAQLCGGQGVQLGEGQGAPSNSGQGCPSGSAGQGAGTVQEQPLGTAAAAQLPSGSGAAAAGVRVGGGPPGQSLGLPAAAAYSTLLFDTLGELLLTAIEQWKLRSLSLSQLQQRRLHGLSVKV